MINSIVVCSLKGWKTLTWYKNNGYSALYQVNGADQTNYNLSQISNTNLLQQYNFTYPIIIFNVDVSFFVNKKFH